MNSHEAFMQTICENPDDDAPRLVYADWLEENGFALLAEFIRVQIELARRIDGDPLKEQLTKRQSVLWSQRKSWRRLPPNWIHTRFEWHRSGLVEHWESDARDFLRDASVLWAFGPIRQLKLTGIDSDLLEVAQSSCLSRLDVLIVDVVIGLNAGAHALAESPFLGKLRELRILLTGRRRIRRVAAEALGSAFGNRLVLVNDA